MCQFPFHWLPKTYYYLLFNLMGGEWTTSSLLCPLTYCIHNNDIGGGLWNGQVNVPCLIFWDAKSKEQIPRLRSGWHWRGFDKIKTIVFQSRGWRNYGFCILLLLHFYNCFHMRRARKKVHTGYFLDLIACLDKLVEVFDQGAWFAGYVDDGVCAEVYDFS